MNHSYVLAHSRNVIVYRSWPAHTFQFVSQALYIPFTAESVRANDYAQVITQIQLGYNAPPTPLNFSTKATIR